MIIKKNLKLIKMNSKTNGCLILISFILLSQYNVFGQTFPFITLPGQLDDSSYAEWISPPTGNENGVFYFRKQVIISSVPDKFIIHVSADNRYRLYVNEHLVSWGPAVSDLFNWNYETVDIAPYLKRGKNIIAAQVWNWGNMRGARQVSYCTGFILQGDSKVEYQANTNQSWLCTKDSGYYFIPMTSEIVGGNYIAGATDSIVGAKHPWFWNKIDFDDSKWVYAIELGKGNHAGLDTWMGTPWLLKERTISSMEQNKQLIPQLLFVKGIPFNVSKYKGNLQLDIPANSNVELLFDNHVLTMGYPHLIVQNGKGSKIKIQYQEALFNANGQKENRSEWQGKEMKGYYDIFMPDGGFRQFKTLWMRTFRYVKLTIETKEEPLNIHEFYSIFTAYPFQQKAVFITNNDTLKKIWNAA